MTKLEEINRRIDDLITVGKLPLRVSQIGADEGYGLRMLVTDAYGWELVWPPVFDGHSCLNS